MENRRLASSDAESSLFSSLNTPMLKSGVPNPLNPSLLLDSAKSSWISAVIAQPDIAVSSADEYVSPEKIKRHHGNNTDSVTLVNKVENRPQDLQKSEPSLKTSIQGKTFTSGKVPIVTGNCNPF